MMVMVVNTGDNHGDDYYDGDCDNGGDGEKDGDICGIFLMMAMTNGDGHVENVDNRELQN